MIAKYSWLFSTSRFHGKGFQLLVYAVKTPPGHKKKRAELDKSQILLCHLYDIHDSIIFTRTLAFRKCDVERAKILIHPL